MNTSFHTYWRELASGSRTELPDTLVLLLLRPLSWLYALALLLRAWLYQTGIYKTQRLPKPVVSIGNITVGGTGKTPATAYIARLLLARGCRVAALSRGYGGSLEGQTSVVSDGVAIMLGAQECGDEPYLLAATVPGLMVVIGPDRYAAGRMAMQQLAPDVFLLDDGFQHLRLQRDLNIVLLDFSRPFGNGLTLPAGILREPLSAMRRADLVIYTRAPQLTALPADSGTMPACVSCHALVDLLPLTGGAAVPFSACQEHKVLAFAGIADPEAFFAALRGAGLNLVGGLNFPDHVDYNKERCEELAAALRESGADYLVTTEKDGVKLQGLAAGMAARTLLARLELTLDEPDKLERLLAATLSNYR